MNTENISVSNAAAILGKKGGESGTGKSKARTRKQAKFAADVRWCENRKSKFWERVAVSEKESCWNWMGGKKQKGSLYGRLRIWGGIHYPHRVAWIFTFGEIPNNLFVCHHCDNPTCCNPNHLFLGTHKDNMADMSKKGRHHNMKGVAHPMAKLNDDSVKQIRSLYSTGAYDRRLLANQFGVHKDTIRDIVNRKNWRHI